MVETTDNYRSKLYKSNAFQHVLSFYDLKTLLDFRLVSQKMADEIVPRNINHLKYECPDDEDEEDPYTFKKYVRHAKKVEIRSICGTEKHLKKIEEIGKNQLGQVEYLYLEFDDEEGTEESEELAM